jgi:ABC-type uncharacterized transport system substrate-binding protein
MYRRAAVLVDRILEGAKPGVPIERAAELETAPSLKAAAVLGIELRQSILERADTVVE